ncbi:MAG: hypothetical protein PVI06_21305 [Desulfobacterales bacterium]|jgi:hypothetical protein
MDISKINFFEPNIWQEGALEKEIERNLAVPEDCYASGTWRPAFDPKISEKYKDTLGGKPIKSYDPNGFLAEMGLAECLTAGRTYLEMLQAFHLVKEYVPDPRYFPLSRRIATFAQKTLLFISAISPRLIKIVDRLADYLVVKRIEKGYMKAKNDPGRYGRMEEILKGDRSDLPKEARYFSILRKTVLQHAWDRGPHTGSIGPGRQGTENFGTYDIALKLGFSESQAKRIAIKCYDVDLGKTHYHDPNDKDKPRATSTAGEIGDIHRHYNRSPDGEEDTRITAARVHLARSLELIAEGYYDAAEQELAIGLHSLQDVLSHSQLTPTTHTIMGEFPDFVKYHPIAMYETAVVTENYLKKFITGLNLKPIDPNAELPLQAKPSAQLIVGNAAPEKQSMVASKMAEFSQALSKFLMSNDICIFVGAQGTRLTDLGFGLDLDGDGKITPGKWVDINQDGEKQWFEVEDQFDDGKEWNRQPAAYHHRNRMIFISAAVVEAPGFEEILKHEINHAVDLTMLDHPQLHIKWKAYIEKLYNTARRQGKIAFTDLDPHQYFARTE